MNKLSFSLLTLLFLSCNSSEPKMDEEVQAPSSNNGPLFEKFIGTWQNKTFGNYEQWEKTGAGQYAAMSYELKGQDTLIQETVKVYKEAGNWIYEVAVKNQNGGQPVKFTSNSVATDHVNFSNPAHDFPTDINYSFEGNTMKAFIAGIGQDGKRDTIPFVFERVGGR